MKFKKPQHCCVQEQKGFFFSQSKYVHYQVFGEGPVKILLISGISCSKELWKEQVEFFTRFSEFQVCIFDNRGMKESSCFLERLTTSLMAEDALKLLNILKWDTFHVVGFSLGGMIAQELAWKILSMPEKRILSLSFLATHLGGFILKKVPPLPGIFFMFQWIGKDPLTKISLELDMQYSPRFLGKYVDNGECVTTVRHQLFDNYLDRFKRLGFQPKSGLISQLLAVFTHNFDKYRAEKVKQSGIPILVAASTDDIIVHTSRTLDLHDQLGGHLVLFQGTGHLIHVEFADQLNKDLLAHIRRSSTQQIDHTRHLNGFALRNTISETETEHANKQKKTC